MRMTSCAYAVLILISPLPAASSAWGQTKADSNSLIERFPAQLAAAADLTGFWQITAQMEDQGQTVAQATPLCEFHEASMRLSGTCKGPNSEGPAIGAVVGNHVTWEWQAKALTAAGGSGTISFKGDIGSDGVIEGTWTADLLPGLTGKFTQRRQAAARPVG
jgi:hypothetical protein